MRIIWMAFIVAGFGMLGCAHLEERAPSAVQYPVPERLPWWGASEMQVKAAFCRNPLPKTSAEIFKYFDRKYPTVNEPFDGSVYGIELRGQNPNLVLALTKLLTPQDRTLSYAAKAANVAKKYNINANCFEVMCAVQKIFGKEVGPQMIFLTDRFDVNTSSLVFENSDPFTADEMRDVIATFEVLPELDGLFASNRQLTKFTRGMTLAEYVKNKKENILANSAITLFDGWSEQSHELRQMTLFHEFAHNFSDNLFTDFDETEMWLGFSGWKIGEEKTRESYKAFSERKEFVSQYSQATPLEDFAESVVAYRFNPKALRNASEAKFNYIRNLIFNGNTYLTEDSCRASGELVKIQEDLKMNEYLFSQTDAAKIKRTCSLPFYQGVLGNYPSSFFRDCVNFEATLIYSANVAAGESDQLMDRKKLVRNIYLDRNLKRSRLDFPNLVSQLKSKLTDEASEWIWRMVRLKIPDQGAFRKKEDYCSYWATLNENYIPDHYLTDNQWQKVNNWAFNNTSPKARAAKRICDILTEDYVMPSQKAPPSEIRAWLQSKGFVEKDREVLPDQNFGASEAKVHKYIEDRFRYF